VWPVTTDPAVDAESGYGVTDIRLGGWSEEGGESGVDTRLSHMAWEKSLREREREREREIERERERVVTWQH
jgi:hypothetical protein